MKHHFDDIVHLRDGSPFWQFWHTESGKRVRVSTQIRSQGKTIAETKQNKMAAITLAMRYQNGDADVRRQLTPKHQAQPEQPLTFTAYLDWWIEHTPRAQANRLQHIFRKLREGFGHLALTDITPDVVKQWATKRTTTRPEIHVPDGQPRRKGKLPKPQTVIREINELKAILKDAVEGGRIAASPLRGKSNKSAFGLKKARVPAKHVLTPSEQQQILNELTAWPERYALALLGMKTLVRLGDLLDLERSHFHRASRRLVFVQTKNEDQHTVVVDDVLMAALDAIPKVGPYYFTSCRAGKPENWNKHVRQWFEAACKRAGIPYGREQGGTHWHAATRRSGATRLLNSGHNLVTVQKLGGWRDIRAAREYLVGSDDAVQAAIIALTPAVAAEKTKD